MTREKTEEVRERVIARVRKKTLIRARKDSKMRRPPAPTTATSGAGRAPVVPIYKIATRESRAQNEKKEGESRDDETQKLLTYRRCTPPP